MPHAHHEVAHAAENLTWLREHIPRPDGLRWTWRSLAEECTRRGTPVSHSGLIHIADGYRTTPSAMILWQLSKIFDIPVAYWFDPVVTDQVKRDVIKILELRDLHHSEDDAEPGGSIPQP